MPAQFPSLKSGFLLCCVGYGIREYSLKSYVTLVGGRTGVANAVHLAGPERVHHTTRAMEVLPADASALVICERRWAWVVLGSAGSILVNGFHYYSACKNRLYRLPPKKDDHEYTVLHVIPITTLTHDRHKPVRKKTE